MPMQKILADSRFTGLGPYTFVGAMSGTSLDGLDLVRVRFWKNAVESPWSKSIEATQWIPYDGNGWGQKLAAAYTASPQERNQLNQEYSQWLNAQFIAFIGQEEVHAIGSHGHTVAHEPDKRFTLQIGNDCLIAQGLNCPVVCDFRVADVLRGGQGAPLVPVADAHLYAEYPVCLNLGGFSNASWDDRGIRRAGDLGPVNFILNPYANQLGYAYDPDGQFARAHQPDSMVLDALEQLAYYQAPFPKSLAREWVETHVFPLLSGLDAGVALATATEHAARAIAIGLHQAPTGAVLVTGGGSKNAFLLERIQAHVSRNLILPHPSEIDFKEATSFAFLALLRLRAEKNVYASVTGSPVDGCDGQVFEDLT
jgi:anhydro-N-acetylmuramic acid kinase